MEECPIPSPEESKKMYSDFLKNVEDFLAGLVEKEDIEVLDKILFDSARGTQRCGLHVALVILKTTKPIKDKLYNWDSFKKDVSELSKGGPVGLRNA
jgi:hypothetical protein